MKWPRYRYALPNLVLVAFLAIAGGWAGFSGAMSLVWLYFPNHKETLVSSPDHHLIFFPPLFGSSPIVYMITAYSIVAACWIAALLLRTKTRKTKEIYMPSSESSETLDR